MERDTQFADRQRKLLEEHERWVAEEGGQEFPVHLDTYMTPEQRQRIEWIKSVCVGEVLEVGCSWGYLSAQLRARVGVDINPHLVDLAKLLAPSREFVCADARSLPFPDGTFRTVVLSEVLEHLPWPAGVEQAIAEARRVIHWAKPGARIVVTVPSEMAKEADSFKHCWINDPAHHAVLMALLGHTTAHHGIEGFDVYVHYHPMRA